MIIFKYFLALVFTFLSCAPSYGQLTPVQEQTLGKNYAENGGFENGVAKWKRYKDTPPASPNEEFPVDGTGGTPTVTLAASTTTPIQGKASGLITKPASNVQGEGYALPFVLDKAAKGKIITISGSYEIASGTYSGGSATTDSDLEVYVYDVDAAQIIQPAGFKLDGGVAGNIYDFNATFQSSLTSSNYRLLIHHATTSAVAFTLKLEIAKIGVQNKSQGPPVTDWTSYTPTGLLTSNTTYSGKWRRVGDSMEVQARMAFSGAANAAAATLDIPSGFTIDTSKINTATSDIGNFGIAYGYDSGLGHAAGIMYVDSNTVSAMGDDGVGGWSNTLPFTVGAGDYYEFNFTVPIVGWGSTVTMSDNADTRVVAMRAGAASGNTTTSQATLVFANKLVDTHGAYNNSTGVYTCPVSGIYEVKATLASSNNISSSQYMAIIIIKNGSNIKQNYLFGSGVSQNHYNNVHDLVSCNAGDLLRIDSVASVSMVNNNSNVTDTFSVQRISGPSQIAASESVSARYKTAAGQSIPITTGAIVDFGTKDWDSHGAVTTGGSWKFTAPISGEYQINSSIRWDGSFTINNTVFARLYKNGVAGDTVSLTTIPSTGSTNNLNNFGSIRIKLLAGEYIQLYAVHQEGTAKTLFANAISNWVEINRVGNY